MKLLKIFKGKPLKRVEGKLHSKDGKLIAAAGTPVKAEKSTTKKANLTKDIKKDISIKKKVLKK